VYCVRCRTPFLNAHPLDEDGVCLACRVGANRFDAAYSFGAYEGTLRELIHLFKYDGIRTLDGPLGRLLLRAFPRDQRFDAIVPMPLHWRRRMDRGFNQSALLAAVLLKGTGLPLEHLVRRARQTESQAGLTSRERRANVRAAFQIPHPGRVAGRRLLLVDDVITTGATLNACAAALKAAGAAHVSVLTLARADRRHWPSFRGIGGH